MKVFIAIAVAISVLATNFLNEPHVNPIHSVDGGPVLVNGTMLTFPTNETHVIAGVFCANALVLNWPSVTGKCYEVQWTCNFANWTNSRAWRVGTGGRIEFLTSMNLPQCFYRVRVVDCDALTNTTRLAPPPPPMPKMRGRL